VESAAHGTILDPFAGSGGLAAGGFDWTWLSADGRSWRPGQVNPEVGPVASDGERIIGASRGSGNELDLWVSTDGRSWQAHADAGDASAKPAWNSTTGSADYFRLLASGLAIRGSDGEDSSSPMWGATPTGSPQRVRAAPRPS
jgi:hypothetical protein